MLPNALDLALLAAGPTTTCREIAERTGYSTSSVYRRAKALGVAIQIRGFSPWTPEETAHAHQLRQDGLSYPAIAQVLGRSLGNVYDTLNPQRVARRRDKKQVVREDPLVEHRIWLAGVRERQAARKAAQVREVKRYGANSTGVRTL